MKAVSSSPESRHLSVVPPKTASTNRLTRARVAARVGVSISTVRRYEGSRLHPQVDEDDVRWFDEKEVAELAAELANEPHAQRRRNVNVNAKAKANASERPDISHHWKGELAAQVFERLEQRQSLAEIVIGVRVEPDFVRALFEQWCLGLTEGQLQLAREPGMPRENEVTHASRDALVSRLAKLPNGQVTRISAGRFRGPFQHGDHAYAEVVELGGFHVSGPCTVEEITRRFGPGDYRITAYGFDPPGLRWELLVEGLPGG